MESKYQVHVVKSTDMIRMSLVLAQADSKHIYDSKNMCVKTESKYFPYLN